MSQACFANPQALCTFTTPQSRLHCPLLGDQFLGRQGNIRCWQDQDTPLSVWIIISCLWGMSVVDQNHHPLWDNLAVVRLRWTCWTEAPVILFRGSKTPKETRLGCRNHGLNFILIWKVMLWALPAGWQPTCFLAYSGSLQSGHVRDVRAFWNCWEMLAGCWKGERVELGSFLQTRKA